MRTKDRATEFTNVRDNKAGTGSYMRTGLRDATECKYLVPSSVQLMNWEDFGSLIILHTYVTPVSNGTETINRRKKAPKVMSNCERR